MSKLEELLQKLCPEGVEIVELGTFAKAETEKNKNCAFDKAYSITQKGLIPTSDYFKEAKVTSEDTSGYKVVRKHWFVYSPSRIDVGSINYLHGEETVIVSPLNVVFSIDEQIVDAKYLLTFLNSRKGTWQILSKREGIEGTGRKMLPFSKFATIEIPLPPLPVQRKIIRILDNFTELAVELTAELTARKKQYEYYKRVLIQNANDIREFSLGDIATVKTGSKPPEILEYPTEYEYINAGTSISGYANNTNCEGDVTTTPSRGQGGIGFVGYQKKPFWLGPLCYRIKSKNTDTVLNRYLFYYLSCFREKILAFKKEGGTPAINGSDLATIVIEVPSIQEQKRIICILDRFDTICNDLTSGLPAEIEARQKQYEYYRDKLLSFKETNI